MYMLSPLNKRFFQRRFVRETPLFLGSVLLLAIIVIFFHLSTQVSASLLFSLLIILIFALLRGLRTALLVSFIAFIVFDYLFIPPIYGFGATKLEDIVVLAFFLLAAVITSQLASSLRTRILQARRREYQSRTLYEFVRATNREYDIEQQLQIFVKAIVEVFAQTGVRDCMLLLPDTMESLRPRNSALQILQQTPLLIDEEVAVTWMMQCPRSIDLYNCLFSFSPEIRRRWARQKYQERKQAPGPLFIRLIPLKTETKVYGILRLLLEEQGKRGRAQNRLGQESAPLSEQNMFFSTFLEQAITMIEQERLRQVGIGLEVLQQTEAVRSAIFSSVSHDLRTPLATIKAAVTNLRQEETRCDPDLYGSSASLIEREVDRLDNLVENLLDMSRIEAGSLRLEKIWYPLDELVADMVRRVQTYLGTREIRQNYPADLPPVKLDVVQIEQVVFNLLENALCYTPEGSPIEIAIRREEEAGTVRVCVADRGPGIPPAEQAKIFTKFYRLSQQEHPRGLGLGLAICQGIIQAHEGQIWVETRAGGGAAFCFTLPLYFPEGHEEEQDE